MSDEQRQGRAVPEDDAVPDSVRELAEQMRELRARSGLTLTALATRTDVSKSSWERYLNCKKFPPRTAVSAFAQAISVRPDRLLLLWDLAARTRARAARGAPTEPSPAPDPDGAGGRQDGREGTGGPGQPDGPHGTGGAREAHASTEETDSESGRPVHAPRAPDEPRPAHESRAPEEPRTSRATPTPRAPRAPRTSRLLGSETHPVHLRRGVLAGLAAVAFLLGAAWIFAPGGAQDSAAQEPKGAGVRAPAPRCVGFACLGRDAHAQRCADGAWTAARAELDGSSIELRYSPECRAAWARLSHAEVGDTVRVVRGRTDHSQHRTLSRDHATHDHSAHGHDAHAHDTHGHDTSSPMVEAPYPGAVRACAARPAAQGGKGTAQRKACTPAGGATPLPYRPPSPAPDAS